MKNIGHIICSFVALVMATASCQKLFVENASEEDSSQVKILLSAPEVQTKSIGDGKKAKVVYYTAFVNGEAVPSLCRQAALGEDGSAVIDITLVKNVNYRFVFWAQTPVADGASPYYDLSSFYVDSKVKALYAVKANDDDRDAFCAAQDIYVDGSKDVTVTLHRPFAQVNFVSSDYEMLKQLNLQTGMHSEMSFVGIPDTITLLDGSVSSSSADGLGVDALFSEAPIPSGKDEYINVLGQDYGYIGMNYVFAPENGVNVSVKGRFINGGSIWETDLVPNVPIKMNYKTNILGELFVEHGKLQVVIVPNFKTPDEVVVM